MGMFTPRLGSNENEGSPLSVIFSRGQMDVKVHFSKAKKSDEVKRNPSPSAVEMTSATNPKIPYPFHDFFEMTSVVQADTTRGFVGDTFTATVIFRRPFFFLERKSSHGSTRWISSKVTIDDDCRSEFKSRLPLD